MKRIYETKRFYIAEEVNNFTTFYIGIKSYNCNIAEGDYFNLETAIDDIEYFEKTIKYAKTLLKTNPLYSN